MSYALSGGMKRKYLSLPRRGTEQKQSDAAVRFRSLETQHGSLSFFGGGL